VTGRSPSARPSLSVVAVSVEVPPPPSLALSVAGVCPPLAVPSSVWPEHPARPRAAAVAPEYLTKFRRLMLSVIANLAREFNTNNN
jgi:hypothetical protein